MYLRIERTFFADSNPLSGDEPETSSLCSALHDYRLDTLYFSITVLQA